MAGSLKLVWHYFSLSVVIGTCSLRMTIVALRNEQYIVTLRIHTVNTYSEHIQGIPTMNSCNEYM